MTIKNIVRRKLPRLDDRLNLGRSSLKVSPFCMGRVTDWRSVPEAFDAGINFFFLSGDLHWPYYEGLRKGLKALLARGSTVRQKMVVCAVSYVGNDFMDGPFYEILETLPELKRLDVLVAGGAIATDFDHRFSQLKRLIKLSAFSGKALGTSFHDRKTARVAYLKEFVDLCFIRYNPVHTGALRDFFPAVRKHPKPKTLLYNFKSMYGRNTLEENLIRAKYKGWWPAPTDFYKFVFAQPEFDGILCMLDTPKYIREMSDAMNSKPLEAEQEKWLREVFDVTRDGFSMT